MQNESTEQAVQETIVEAAPIEGITADAVEAVGETTGADTEIKSAEKTAEEIAKDQQAERFAAKFAALSRKEKEIRTREAAMQKQLADLEAKINSIKSQEEEITKFRNLPSRLKQEPLKVLEESGLSFQQLAEMVLNDGKPTQDMVMQEYEKKVMGKVQELEQKLAEKEAKEAQERHEAALGQFKAQLTDFVNNNAEYELIKANDAVEVVYELIEQHYAETQQILSNKEASDAVEEYLLEEAKKLVDRDKVKKLLTPPTPTKPAAPTGKTSTTLSNAQAAQAPKSGAAKKMSNEESMLEAAKLIKWVE